MKVIIGILLVILIAPITMAQIDHFTIEVEFDQKLCTFRLIEGDQESELSFQFKQVQVTGSEVLVSGTPLATKEGLIFGNRFIAFDSLSLGEVVSMGERYKLVLEKRVVREQRRRAASGGDLIVGFQHVDVEPREFIRGDLLSFAGDIVIHGEVNGYVVAFFGDVRLSESAICQRDVFAVGGSIEKHRQARIHGTHQATDGWRGRKPAGRKYRSGDEDNVEISGSAAYNRVDGVLGSAKVTFRSEERFLPQFNFAYGYGFWSKRSKYDLGIEHVLFDYNQVRFGGSLYRWTKTDDEWRCGEGENSLYAIIAREDFRDYYEGEGGKIFAEQTIGYDHTFRLDYAYDELRFMEANRNLWSLFGGDKKFRPNFSSVSDDLLADHRADYRKNEAVMSLTYIYNTVEDYSGHPARSGWLAALRLEHSSDWLGSDFDYDRYQMEFRRHQPLTYRQNLNVRLLYGSAHGTLPLHRYFYLGGIRTLRAFNIKEFRGNYMALADAEYVIDFPKTTIEVSALFDVGKTGSDSEFLSEGNFLADVGIGLRLGDGFRLELTRQINGWTKKMQFSILYGRSF